MFESNLPFFSNATQCILCVCISQEWICEASRAKMMNSKLLYFFFLFFIHLCSVYSFNGTHKCSNEQMDALLLFKQNISHSIDVYSDPHYYYCESLLGSGYHPITMNWNKSIDCYHWNGVKRNHLGDVIGLELRCGMLKGTHRL